MAIVDYAGFVAVGLTTDGFPVRSDGWILKYTDNGKQYHRVAGQWVDMELGLSFAPPTKSGSLITDGDGVGNVLFVTPFVDDAYTIALTCNDPEDDTVPVALVFRKYADAFSFYTRNTASGKTMGGITVSWLATRNYDA